MGLFLEEFEVGRVDISPRRTVTETDVVTYTAVSGDTNPMHTDDVYAKASPIGARIAHGTLVLSMATGLSARLGYMDGTAIAGLGVHEWRFVAPCFIGDTIHLRATILDARATSKPDRGIVTRRMEIFNQHDTLLQSGIMQTMVRTLATKEAF